MPDRDALAGLPESRHRLAGLAGMARLAGLARLAWLTPGAGCATCTAGPACAGRPASAGRPAHATVTAVAAGSTLAAIAAVAAGSTLAAIAVATAGGIEMGRAADRADVVDHVTAGHRRGGQRDPRPGQYHASGRAEASDMTGASQHVARLAISRRTKEKSHLPASYERGHHRRVGTGRCPLRRWIVGYLHNVSSWLIWLLRVCRNGF